MQFPLSLASPRNAMAILLPKEHIFFLSHMRAYSSLFGHIMGSHPQICGYYELHIGYHSWKSLIRQKMLFFRDEQAKPGLRFMFDKVLHDDHHVAPGILNARTSRVIFALRHPAKTIPSIMKLYATEDPADPFNDPGFATAYYIDRAQTLTEMARAMDGAFFYLDAEALTRDTDRCLQQLSGWLKLESPLDPNYSMQKKTSQSKFGDTSARLRSGKIERAESTLDTSAMDPALLARALDTYTTGRRTMIALSTEHCLVEH